ncbi:NAD(P)/FAD-dependent oxidoreductase, partial [Sphingomonas phyllosphaerae]|uniref:NAD(P)/FAD-dependent oxidoreductase n=1 Tax=Sphingomonas phyllosphaerae TaxID=257003 RepID=UPI002FFA26F1
MIRSTIVVGDGVVALNVALALQRRGTQVTIVAPDAPWRGASWGNAGHIAVEQVEPLASLATVKSVPKRLFSRGGALALPARAIRRWLPFTVRLLRASTPARFARGKTALSAMLATAIPAWQRVLAEAGAPELLRLDGHFIVWETPESAAQGRASWLAADTGGATVRDVTAEEFARLRTLTTAPIAGAVRVEGSGQITDTGALGATLAARFAAQGGARVYGRARSIAAAADGATVTLEDGSHWDADVVVVAAGAASAPLVESQGLRAPLIAERGYHIEGEPGDWPADQPPVVFEDRSMIVTRFAGRLRAASIVEFAAVETPADPRKWARAARACGGAGAAAARSDRTVDGRPADVARLSARDRAQGRDRLCVRPPASGADAVGDHGRGAGGVATGRGAGLRSFPVRSVAVRVIRAG